MCEVRRGLICSDDGGHVGVMVNFLFATNLYLRVLTVAAFFVVAFDLQIFVSGVFFTLLGVDALTVRTFILTF